MFTTKHSAFILLLVVCTAHCWPLKEGEEAKELEAIAAPATDTVETVKEPVASNGDSNTTKVEAISAPATDTVESGKEPVASNATNTDSKNPEDEKLFLFPVFQLTAAIRPNPTPPPPAPQVQTFIVPHGSEMTIHGGGQPVAIQQHGTTVVSSSMG